MFDLGFSELIVIGIVALVVLGPERLPVVARVAGKYFAKARRLINQVKEDIELESELAEIKSIESEARNIAQEVSENVRNEVSSIQGEVDSLRDDVENLGASFKKEGEGLPWTETPKNENKKEGERFSDFGAVRTVSVTAPRNRENPELEDIVEEVEKLKRRLGDASPALTERRRKSYAPRSRSNRVRIYR